MVYLIRYPILYLLWYGIEWERGRWIPYLFKRYGILAYPMGSWHFRGISHKNEKSSSHYSSHYTSRNTYIIFDTMGYPTAIPYYY